MDDSHHEIQTDKWISQFFKHTHTVCMVYFSSFNARAILFKCNIYPICLAILVCDAHTFLQWLCVIYSSWGHRCHHIATFVDVVVLISSPIIIIHSMYFIIIRAQNVKRADLLAMAMAKRVQKWRQTLRFGDRFCSPTKNYTIILNSLARLRIVFFFLK